MHHSLLSCSKAASTKPRSEVKDSTGSSASLARTPRPMENDTRNPERVESRGEGPARLPASSARRTAGTLGAEPSKRAVPWGAVSCRYQSSRPGRGCGQWSRAGRWTPPSWARTQGTLAVARTRPHSATRRPPPWPQGEGGAPASGSAGRRGAAGALRSWAGGRGASPGSAAGQGGGSCCRMSLSWPGPLPPPEPHSSRLGLPEVTRLSKPSPEVFARCLPIQKVVPPPRFFGRGGFHARRS